MGLFDIFGKKGATAKEAGTRAVVKATMTTEMEPIVKRRLTPSLLLAAAAGAPAAVAIAERLIPIIHGAHSPVLFYEIYANNSISGRNTYK